MTRQELRKLFGSRAFLLLFLALLAANAVLARIDAQAHRVDFAFSDAVRSLLVSYREDPDAFDEKYAAYREAQDAVIDLQMQYFLNHETPPEELFEESYTLAPESGYGDGQLYRALYEQVGRREAYREKVEEILRDAERNLATVGDPYTRSYNEQVRERYASLYATPLSDDYAVGWGDYFRYTTGSLLLLPLLLAGALLLAHADAESGMEEVLFATKKGRNAIWTRKALALLAVCVGSVLLFDATSLAVYAATTPLCGLGEFLASFDGFTLCPYPLYAYEFLLLREVFCIVFCCLTALLFLFLARLFGNPLLTLGVGVAFCGVEVLLYRLPSYRLGDVWQTLNLFRLWDAGNLFSQYRSVGIFGRSVPLVLFVPSVFCIGTAVCLGALWLLWSRRKNRRIRVRLPKMRLRLPLPHTLAHCEARKLFVRSGLLLPILLLLLCKGFSAGNAANGKLPFQESVYRSYLQTYQNVPLDEAERLIAEEQANFDDLQRQAALYAQKWKEGTATYGEALAAQSAWETAQRKLEPFQRAADEVARVRELRDGGVDAQVVYGGGWEALCLQKTDLFLLLLLLFPAFAYAAEDRCGFRPILYAAENGRMRTALVKLALCVGSAATAGALCFLADALSVRALYTLPLSNAPAVSVPALADLGAGGTLFGFVLRWGVCRILLCSTVALLGFALSAGIRHPLFPTLALAALLFPPYLVGLFAGGAVPSFCLANLFDLSVAADGTSLPLRIAFPLLTLLALALSLRSVAGRRNKSN